MPASSTEELQLFDHQWEFFNSTKRFPCLDGGWGNGKSTAWMVKLADHCERFPDTKVGVFRQDLVDLRRSTIQQDWLPMFGDHGSYSGTDHTFEFDYSSSQVIFHQLSELTKLKNHNLSAFVIEQAEETVEQAFWYLVGRLRRTDAYHYECPGCGWRTKGREVPETGCERCDVPRRDMPKVNDQFGAAVTNPAGHDWIWKLWCEGRIPEPTQSAMQELEKNEIDPPSADDFHYITASSFDNPELADTTLASYTTLPEKLYKRFVEGDRETFEGQIYSMLDSGVHRIEPFEVPKAWPKWVTLDWASSKPTAVLWITMDYDGRVYIYREQYKVPGDDGIKWLVSDHARAIKEVEQDKNDPICPYNENIRWRLIDPQCRAKVREKDGKKISIMEEFEDYDLYFDPWPLSSSKQETNAQINRVGELFIPKEGRIHPVTHNSPAPLAYFFHTAKDAWEEHTQWKWADAAKGMIESPDEPEDGNDHTCDAFRGWVAEKLPAPTHEDEAPPGSFEYERRMMLQEDTNPGEGHFDVGMPA